MDAQAIDNDLVGAAIKRRLAQTQAASQATIANRSPTYAPAVPPTATNATQAEFDAARNALKLKTPRVPPQGVAAGLAGEPVPVSDLSPAERLSYARAQPASLAAAQSAEIKAAQAATNARLGTAQLPPLSPEPIPAAAPAGAAPGVADGVGAAPGVRSFRFAPAGTPSFKLPPEVPPVGAPATGVAKLLGAGGRLLGGVAGVYSGGREALGGVADATANGLNSGNTGDIVAGGSLASGSTALALGAGGLLAPVAVAGGTGYAIGKDISDRIGPSDNIGGAANQLAQAFGFDGAEDATSREARLAGIKASIDKNPSVRSAAAGAASKAAIAGIRGGIGTGVGNDAEDVKRIPGVNGQPASLELKGTPTGAPSSLADNIAPAAPTYAPSVSSDLGQALRDKRIADIESGQGPAGRLYAKLLEDTTPTGKRNAGQFLSDYMGQGTSEVNDRASLEGDRLRSEAGVEQGRESNASQDGRQNRLDKRAKDDPSHYIFADDGSVSSIDNGILTPLKDASGKKAIVKKTADIPAAVALKNLQTVAANADGQFTAKQVKAASDQLDALLSASSATSEENAQ